MGLKETIQTKVNQIVTEDFVTTDITYIPDISDSKLTFGNTGLKFTAAVLFIDMRGSTQILNAHYKRTVAKIHMAYFHTILKIAASCDGQVRSFNGDSVLVFFYGDTKGAINDAVRAAMQMHFMLADINDGINKELLKQNYSSIDFGMGIDHGEILATKVGLGGDANNKDLIWIGNAVNKSAKMSDQVKLPTSIAISGKIECNLYDDSKYHTTVNNWGYETKTNMWSTAGFTYNGQYETFYKTSYIWKI